MVDQQITRRQPSLSSASDVSRSFRGLKALSGYSVTSAAGEILGVIGPNGAGKTTLFNVITGFMPPTDRRRSHLERRIDRRQTAGRDPPRRDCPHIPEYPARSTA